MKRLSFPTFLGLAVLATACVPGAELVDSSGVGGGSTGPSNGSSSSHGAGGGICTPVFPPTPVPDARSTHGIGTGTDGKIYMFGGGTTAGFDVVSRSYDPCTGVWKDLAPMPTLRGWGARATRGRDGRFYVAGGAGTNVVEVYDPKADSWYAVAPMLEVREEFGFATGLDGRLYAFGGWDGSALLASAEAYDIGSNSWSSIAPMKTARWYFRGATGNDGRIYALGGGDSACAVFTDAEAYKVGANTWSALPPLPTAQELYGIAVAPDGRILLVGGEGPGGCASGVDIVQAFDPAGPSWSSLASMPIARKDLGAAVAAGHYLFAIGGGSENEAFDTTTNAW